MLTMQFIATLAKLCERKELAMKQNDGMKENNQRLYRFNKKTKF